MQYSFWVRENSRLLYWRRCGCAAVQLLLSGTMSPWSLRFQKSLLFAALSLYLPLPSGTSGTMSSSVRKHMLMSRTCGPSPSGFSTRPCRFLTRRFLQTLTNRDIHPLHPEGSVNDSHHLERAAAGAPFPWW